MSATNDGGAAFPVTNTTLAGMSGMSLRDWFAGQVLAACGDHIIMEDSAIAERAYNLADAMLAAREKGKE